MMRCKPLILGLLVAGGLAGLSSHASAQLDFHVFIDTSHVTPGTDLGAEFTLSDGSAGFTNTNSVLISNINYGGSYVGTIPPAIGNASVDPGTGNISLADGDPGGIADIETEFTAGTGISFDTHVTIPTPSATAPDIFQVRLLTNPTTTNDYISTTAPSGQSIDNAFVAVSLTNATMPFTLVQRFGNTTYPITVTISAVSSTPEPDAMSLLAGGALASAGMLRRRRRLAGR